jgi:hypothetical protein
MSVLTGHRGQISIMVFVTCAVLLLSFISPANAVAGTWRLLTPSEAAPAPGTAASNLNGVFMINGGTSGKNTGKGWAVGDHSLIFFWDGFSWNQYSAPAADCQLNSVNFGGPLNPLSSISATSGWAVGGSGVGGACGTNPVALYWNGAGWQSQTVQATLVGLVSATMTSVSMVKPFGAVNSADTMVDAWAVGGETDGGGTHGVVWHFVGSPGAGAWIEIPAPATLPTGTQLNGVYMSHCASNPCTTGADGIAVGNYFNGPNPGLYKVSGGTITAITSPVTVNLNSVAMSSPTTGWAVGDSCTIIRTPDGTTWNAVFPKPCSGGTPNLRSIVMTSSSEGWIVGDANGGAATILHGTSLDSSSSAVWSPIVSTQVTSNVGLNSVTFATSGGNLWAVGASGVAAFCLNNCGSQSGAIWATTSSPLGGSYVQLNSVAMDSDTDGWAVGQLGPLHTSPPVVMQWNGYSWNTAILSSSLGSTPLLGVALSGGSNGWAVGALGVTGKPSTVYWNGNSWQTVTSSSCTCNLTSVFMRSGSEAWATATGGPATFWPMWQSTSTGGFFGIHPFAGVDPNMTLESVTFDPSNNQNGWAVGFIPHSTFPLGGGGPVPVIVSTTSDGADNWPTEAKFPALSGFTLNSVSFVDSTHGWAAGSGTTILNWNGFTWNPSSVILTTPSPPVNITSIQVDSVSPPDGWAVGFDQAGRPVLLAYDGSGWYQTTNLVPSYFPSAAHARLTSLFLRSGTSGLAVGSNVLSGPFPNLAVILHLDPPGGGPPPPPPSSTTSTSTVVTTSTSVVSSSSSTTSSIISSSTSSSQTVASTSVVTTTVISTPTTTSTSESTSTSSTSSVSTPMTLPPIPGFPWESIIAGIIVGMTALAIVRRRRK